MKRSIATRIALLTVVLVGVGLIPQGVDNFLAAQTAVREIPTFALDTSWPKKLPNNWVLGSVSGINVDAQDHVWLITRPREKVNAAQKAGVAAPPVVELDAQGNFIQAWGGPGAGYEWFDIEHGITVDSKGFVWIAGSGREADDQILKFTRDGKFVMQIGKKGQSKGNSDKANVRGAADVTYYAPTNEIFVADGYVNRRVVVFDAETGAYKRMWGAFGNVATDIKPGEKPATTPVDVDTSGRGPEQFSNSVHGIRVSKDGLVYVCDRQNQRVQVFTVDGKYVTQVFISRGKLPESKATGMVYGQSRKEVEDGVISSNQSASRTTFSPDPQQRFLYVLDRRHQKIAILDRKSLEILGYFGGGIGEKPGQFYILHDMATDSKGNFYTAEINQNGRAQKFAFKGMSPLPAK
jgi:hypothetical protein